MAHQDEVNYLNTRLTKLDTAKTNFVSSGKTDAAGFLDISAQVGFVGMELTRLNGAEGRKGTVR